MKTFFYAKIFLIFLLFSASTHRASAALDFRIVIDGMPAENILCAGTTIKLTAIYKSNTRNLATCSKFDWKIWDPTGKLILVLNSSSYTFDYKIPNLTGRFRIECYSASSSCGICEPCGRFYKTDYFHVNMGKLEPEKSYNFFCTGGTRIYSYAKNLNYRVYTNNGNLRNIVFKYFDANGVLLGTGDYYDYKGSIDNYKVIVKAYGACSSLPFAEQDVILPKSTATTLNVNSGSTICGQPGKLVASSIDGGATYSWTGPNISGSVSGATLNVPYSKVYSKTTYTVTMASRLCGVFKKDVQFEVLPSLSIANPGIVCQNANYTLSASGTPWVSWWTIDKNAYEVKSTNASVPGSMGSVDQRWHIWAGGLTNGCPNFDKDIFVRAAGAVTINGVAVQPKGK